MNFDLNVLKIDPKKELEKLKKFIIEQLQVTFRRRGIIVGLSGGIDLACMASVSVYAIGKENVVETTELAIKYAW